jgi:hypothetical protein
MAGTLLLVDLWSWTYLIVLQKLSLVMILSSDSYNWKQEYVSVMTRQVGNNKANCQ